METKLNANQCPKCKKTHEKCSDGRKCPRWRVSHHVCVVFGTRSATTGLKSGDVSR